MSRRLSNELETLPIGRLLKLPEIIILVFLRTKLEFRDFKYQFQKCPNPNEAQKRCRLISVLEFSIIILHGLHLIYSVKSKFRRSLVTCTLNQNNYSRSNYIKNLVQILMRVFRNAQTPEKCLKIRLFIIAMKVKVSRWKILHQDVLPRETVTQFCPRM